jgi:Family of unknown function (DUF6335)
VAKKRAKGSRQRAKKGTKRTKKAAKRAATRTAKKTARKGARKRAKAPIPTLRTPPSSLDMNRSATAARSGRRALKENQRQHNKMGAVTGGDVDADMESAYFSGDEAPGGDNPTPDQNDIDDIGHSIGVEYNDNQELRGGDEVTDRDKHRWENE